MSAKLAESGAPARAISSLTQRKAATTPSVAHAGRLCQDSSDESPATSATAPMTNQAATAASAAADSAVAKGAYAYAGRWASSQYAQIDVPAITPYAGTSTSVW